MESSGYKTPCGILDMDMLAKDAFAFWRTQKIKVVKSASPKARKLSASSVPWEPSQPPTGQKSDDDHNPVVVFCQAE